MKLKIVSLKKWNKSNYLKTEPNYSRIDLKYFISKPNHSRIEPNYFRIEPNCSKIELNYSIWAK